jgi:antitoxin VapB
MPGKEGDELIIEPTPRASLLEVLETWEPLDEELPESDDLGPLEDVDL